MPGKKKNKQKRPLAPSHSDSLRRDIEAAELEGDGVDDLAADLLATLDARDAAEAAIAANNSNSLNSSAAPTPHLGSSGNPDPFATPNAGVDERASYVEHQKEEPAKQAQEPEHSSNGKRRTSIVGIPIPSISVSVSRSRKSSVSGEGGAAAQGNSPESPSKRISSDLKAAGHKLMNGFRHGGGKDSTDASPSSSSTTLAAAGQDTASSSSSGHHMGGISSFFHARSPPLGATAAPGAAPNSSSDTSRSTGALNAGGGTSGFGASRKPNRAKARLQRREAANEALRQEAELELRANGGQPDLAAREKQGIDALCAALKRDMHEVTPDGHCLYAAVADQLNLLGAASGLTYRDTRKAAAEVMRRNPDDFKPFISDSDEKLAGVVDVKIGADASEAQQEKFYLAYCDAVESTGLWGGQPEILALSRAFSRQINVVQVGFPTLKVGEEDFGAKHGGDEGAVFISYHRKMYGLGEHYNSLRKRI